MFEVSCANQSELGVVPSFMCVFFSTRKELVFITDTNHSLIMTKSKHYREM